MGHRISPYICQRVTSALKFIHYKLKLFLLNYIDDFVGAEHKDIVQFAYERLGKVLHMAGLQENYDKTVPPSQVIEFLGVTFNAVKCTIEVFGDRLEELHDLLLRWTKKKWFDRKELESFIGKLQFMATCMRPGRVFVSRLLNTLRTNTTNSKFPVDSELLKDVWWWLQFLPHYNGVSIAWMKQHMVPDLVLSADASKKGVGGYLTDVAFYRLDVPREWQQVNIAYLELWAIIIALRIWASELTGHRIVMQCDNESVVNILTFGWSRDLFLQAGMREIIFPQAMHTFELKVVHIFHRDKIESVTGCHNGGTGAAGWLFRYLPEANL